MIKLKLFAALQDRLPPGSVNHTMELEVEPGTTPADVVRKMQIPEQLAHLIMIEGQHLTREEVRSRQLREGEVMSIFPPIAGGRA